MGIYRTTNFALIRKETSTGFPQERFIIHEFPSTCLYCWHIKTSKSNDKCDHFKSPSDRDRNRYGFSIISFIEFIYIKKTNTCSFLFVNNEIRHEKFVRIFCQDTFYLSPVDEREIPPTCDDYNDPFRAMFTFKVTVAECLEIPENGFSEKDIEMLDGLKYIENKPRRDHHQNSLWIEQELLNNPIHENYFSPDENIKHYYNLGKTIFIHPDHLEKVTDILRFLKQYMIVYSFGIIDPQYERLEFMFKFYKQVYLNNHSSIIDQKCILNEIESLTF